MKTKKLVIIASVIGMISWSCTSENPTGSSLQLSLDQSSKTLSNALTAITTSPGYQVLATPSVAVSTASKVFSPVVDSTFNTILLSDIVGEYEFNKANTYQRWKQPITNFFSKTADNESLMIVRLPEEKIKRPNSLFMYNPADTLLTNNYVFTLNKYDYKFNRVLGWDYTMASTINVKSVDAGALSIQSSSSKEAGYKFASEFAFTNGYTTKSSYTTGDTAVSVYAIYEGAKVIYEESFTAIKTAADMRHREREYAMTIGDVKIVRQLGPTSLDSAKVYLTGVLQTTAKVEVVDIATADGTDVSVTAHKRELKITFDDGTSKTISELLGTSVETIRNLFISLRQSYFATGIVDRIAWDIYMKK
ncbi:MAG: hypothetical protein AUK44_05960 [Porphyromonadaceae bacterium CG2_30_38_12]|nr:MAG: hypothetical protein AUK44_05960 [Porphyromonadaceae bacterium CG2_30_38_12]